MKKLFFILVFGLIASFSQAQMATVNIQVGQSYFTLATDYTVTNTTVSYLLIKAPQHYPTTQDLLVNLDSISGNHTNVAVKLYGRKFDTGAWAQIGSTVNWKGTTADTTIVVSNATANRYRDYKIEYTGTGTGATKVDLQQFKLFFE